MNNNAAIFLPYYGTPPPYFGAYLKSLEGKDFDVLWISDLEVPHHPDNFKICRMSLDNVIAQAEKALQTKIVINGGRRLCDFRPMYGLIFEDLISNYGYWGWGDCDLVYGNAFNGFIERTVATGQYDAISLHRAYMSGPTCFFRNSRRMKNLFRETDNWCQVCAFEGPGGVCIFDECGGQFHARLSSNDITLADCARERDSISAALWRAYGLELYHEDEIDEESLANGETLRMDNGRLTINGREIAVFHFVHAKVPRWFRVENVPYDKVGDYWVDSHGFYHSRFAWHTRHVRHPSRKFTAMLEAIRQHGLRHVLERIKR